MGKGPANRYELVSCAIHGHTLVGTDVADLSSADPALARQWAGQRWHRCLRCDDWVPRPAPPAPGREGIAGTRRIAVPLRGPALRDRYVLRLIALDRAVHVAVLTVLALLIFLYLGHRHQVLTDYDNIMRALTGGPTGANASHGFLAHFRHYLLINPSDLYVAGLVVVAYGALEATEMVGLWYAKRWAEYLTFVATIALIPLEVYELTESVTTLKLVTLIINVAIAAYLLLAKRLFGLRGGHRVVVERRRDSGGGRPSIGPRR